MSARSELLNCISNHKILCARINFAPGIFDENDRKDYLERGWESEPTEIVLKYPHTNEEYEEFLSKLDFDYDSGYGSQELDGVVWLDNGAWLSRGEYDGSEWWEYHRYPDIPDDLKNIQLERELNIDSVINE